MERRKSGFTLIELLIVVAIIAILAAIAVPNFLEAQTRAKVSRVKTDMRSIATAIEAYVVDSNKYPAPIEAHTPYMPGDINIPPYTMKTPSRLTTPIAYMTSLPNDVFYHRPGAAPPPPLPEALFPRFFYISMDHLLANPTFAPPAQNAFLSASRNGGIWMMWSVGPDKDEFNRPNPPGPPDDPRLFRDYDSTNGTTSLGNIFRTHRSSDGIGYQPDLWQNP
jgi:type II secretion system protein G